MKTLVNKLRGTQGYTLIEIVAVLAILAILAALLLPRIIAAIREAQFSATVTAINTPKTAAVAYYAKYGRFGGVNGGQLTDEESKKWDNVLLREGLIERPFEINIGKSARVQLVRGPGSAGGINDSGYDLNGDGKVDTSGDTLEVVIEGLTPQEAIDLNNRFDADIGNTISDLSSDDTAGKVQIKALDAVEPTVTAYVYLTSTLLASPGSAQQQETDGDVYFASANGAQDNGSQGAGTGTGGDTTDSGQRGNRPSTPPGHQDNPSSQAPGQQNNPSSQAPGQQKKN